MRLSKDRLDTSGRVDSAKIPATVALLRLHKLESFPERGLIDLFDSFFAIHDLNGVIP